MAYVLRFVQRYRPADRPAFMALEARFAALEQRRNDFPKGRRLQPYAGRDTTSSLVWECTFDSLQKAQAALALLESDPEHGELYCLQSPLMTEAWTEIYEVLDFAGKATS